MIRFLCTGRAGRVEGRWQRECRSAGVANVGSRSSRDKPYEEGQPDRVRSGARRRAAAGVPAGGGGAGDVDLRGQCGGGAGSAHGRAAVPSHDAQRVADRGGPRLRRPHRAGGDADPGGGRGGRRPRGSAERDVADQQLAGRGADGVPAGSGGVPTPPSWRDAGHRDRGPNGGHRRGRLRCGAAARDAGPRDMIRVQIGRPLRLTVVGTPDYFERHGTPLKPADLAQHACLRARMPSGLPSPWEFLKSKRAKSASSIAVEVPGPMVLDSALLMLEGARAGLALAQVAQWYVEADVAAGRLVRVLDDWAAPLPALCLYYSGHRMSGRVEGVDRVDS
ncbi:lysR substrate binding domain-containing protein [Ditylenchus destructor]|nr:lysR substrate binding domain-containing protein [Ditylenchus destructor]